MQTQDMMLAAFVGALNTPVRKLAEDLFEFDLEETSPIVVQFTAPDGYNMNINKFMLKMEELSLAPIYVAPVEEPAQ